jgi:hypothetical protein
MRVENRASLSAAELANIVVELSSQENLRDVMDWALAQAPGSFTPSVVSDVIVQDEFTHDVVVPWRDGLSLVFDTT